MFSQGNLELKAKINWSHYPETWWLPVQTAGTGRKQQCLQHQERGGTVVCFCEDPLLWVVLRENDKKEVIAVKLISNWALILRKQEKMFCKELVNENWQLYVVQYINYFSWKLGMGQVKQIKTFTDTTKRTLIFLQSFGRKNVKIFPVHTGLLSRYTEAFPHTSVVR